MIIYGLKDPREKDIRYIGKTIYPERRYREHITMAIKREKLPISKWILKLKNEAIEPEMIVIEECEKEKLDERERFYISFYRSQGVDLLNVTEGGEGGATMAGKKFTIQHRERISESLRGHTVSENNRRKSSERLKKLQADGRCNATRFQKGRIAHNKIFIDEIILKELYLKEKLSIKEIEKRLDVGSWVIKARIKELGIFYPRRKRNRIGKIKIV